MDYDLLLRQRQHQLRILQIFPPHLNDGELLHKEWTCFALEIARIGIILIAPCCVLYHLDVIKLDSVLCDIAVALCILELFILANRHFILYPEGRAKRLQYWHQLGMSDKLKMLEFYHRASKGFLCRFPATVTTKEVRRFYIKQNAILLTFFADLYVLCMVLLIISHLKERPIYIWLLYFASVLNGLLIVHIGKRHLLELDAILILRNSPELAIGVARQVPAKETSALRTCVSSYHSAVV
uniref:Uncharacterized protein AlNc14C1567G12992 n=1 Tax=Albugo laibachii Nc14 TaxID=890382 RepID=F0X2R9_9STRA|nr:conserved hypothetical protein [Albugo laibachii Nc14]|eukprot:CCA28213.1 conserved hypothetical protein [Albugo laibachii Nc14]